SPALLAAVTCSAPNSALDEVSDPVIATPIQPRIGDRIANSPPAPAIHLPSVVVCPLAFITYARPSTAITVTIAQRSWTSGCRYPRSAAPGDTRRTSMVMRPAMRISVPVAASQFSVNTGIVDGLPLADTMCRPGQLNFLNRYGWFGSDRNVLIGPICASTN